MCNGNVLKSDVKLLGTLEEVAADAVGDGFTLGDELCGIELGDDGFKDFVSDGWEDTLIVILPEVLWRIRYSFLRLPLEHYHTW